MHNAVHSFLQEVKREYPLKFKYRKRVLECGSRDINGSPRKYFHWLTRYFGIDIGKGKGVDKVISASDYSLPKNYDVVISTEMLEHDMYWKQSLSNMYGNLKVGGLLIITCAGPDREEHGTKATTPNCSPDTTDYYRNLSHEDFRSVLPRHFFDVFVLKYERGQNDLMFYGIKKDSPSSAAIYEKLLSRKENI